MSLSGIVAAIVAEHDVGVETAERDVREFLLDLGQAGIIREV
jgi:hypothetical protein